MPRRDFAEPWLHQASRFWCKKVGGELHYLDRYGAFMEGGGDPVPIGSVQSSGLKVNLGTLTEACNGG